MRVEVPHSAAAVVGALSPGAIVIAGGTQVMPHLNNHAHDGATIVSLRRAGLSGIEIEANNTARVGAATTLATLGRHERLAFLRPVVESIASPTIRNLATVGGNLFVAQPYGDLAVALLALDAHADVAGPDGTRTVPVANVLNDGIADNEIVTSVSFDLPEAGEWYYMKAMRRKLNSASIVTVAAVVTVDGGTVASARIALGGAARRPIRAASAEAALINNPFDRAHVETAATAAADDDADPFTDSYASAWYRRRVLPVHIRRALIGD